MSRKNIHPKNIEYTDAKVRGFWGLPMTVRYRVTPLTPEEQKRERRMDHFWMGFLVVATLALFALYLL